MSAILLANGQALSVADMVGQGLGRGANRAQCMRHRQGHPHRRRRGRWPDPGTVRRGHPQAVVSLWPTIDLTTCLLMRRFYQRLADTSVAGALGRARSQLASLTLYQQAEELVVLQEELVKQDASPAVLETIERAATAHRGRGAQDHASDFWHPRFWAPFIHLGLP